MRVRKTDAETGEGESGRGKSGVEGERETGESHVREVGEMLRVIHRATRAVHFRCTLAL